MFATLLLASFALVAAQVQDPEISLSRGLYLDNPEKSGEARLLVNIPLERMPSPKISPLNKWEFPFMVAGYVREAEGGDMLLRFRVYHQRNREEGEPGPYVARTLLRLWDFNHRSLKLDHSLQYNKRIVDVYLAWGGPRAGGEHRFDVDSEGGQERKVNTIYIYRLDSFTDPVEMAREIAHEYGHATLPAVGGFKSPEMWANGYLGERLYLRYLRDELAAGRLIPQDALNATTEGLDAWVKANVDPWELKAATEGPDAAALKRVDKASMDQYTGVAVYAQAILPQAVFARSLVIIGSVKASDYPGAVVRAVREPAKVEMSIPPRLRNRAIWIPCDAAAKISGAKVLKRRAFWSQVRATGQTVTVTNRRA